MNLGERIYRLRTERNMSQGDLAEALEVSRQSVSKWENNSAVPELDKLVRMHEIFGVTLDELVLEEKPQPEAGAEVPEPEVTVSTVPFHWWVAGMPSNSPLSFASESASMACSARSPIRSCRALTVC